MGRPEVALVLALVCGVAACGDKAKPSNSPALPDAAVEPDATTTPDADAEPDSSTTPDADAEPDSSTTPDADAEPDSSATPDADASDSSSPIEDCANGLDDDGDGAVDCDDDDCVAICATSAACAASTSADAVNSGDTTTGSSLFAGSCVGGSGGLEQVYAYTPAQTGVLTITLDSDADQGVYVRTDCRDETTELGCIDAEFGGAEEVLAITVAAEVPLGIFVDGFGDSSEAGTYTLTLDLVPDVCGNGLLTGAEACDDGNTDNNDGCSATCQIELGFYCAARAGGVLGDNAGNSATGTYLFEGSCTGGTEGLEQLIGFTPGSPGETGVLTLTLASSKDLGIYVRTACEDESSELGCVDEQPRNVNEVLVLDVQGGVPLTIFVDGFYSPAEAGSYVLNIGYVPD